MEIRTIDIHTHSSNTNLTTPHTVGIHPWEAELRSVDELRPLLGQIEAIGEIGLDFARGPKIEVQISRLREQLELAQQSKLPVILHCVRAFEPMMEILADYTLRAVIFHGFIGSPEQATRAIERDYYLSFGERTFVSPKTVAALRATPLNRLFCETDQSDLSIDDIYNQISTARGVARDELAEAIEQNYKQIFETK